MLHVALQYLQSVPFKKVLMVLGVTATFGWLISILLYGSQFTNVIRFSDSSLNGNKKGNSLEAIVKHQQHNNNEMLQVDRAKPIPPTTPLSMNEVVEHGTSSSPPTTTTANEQSRLKMLIAVISAVHQFSRRMGVRKTWGDHQQLSKQFGDHYIGPIFFVGTLKSNEINPNETDLIQRALEAENRTYGDIVQVAVDEDFRQLTPKMLEVYQYIARTYADEIASWKNLYILKADDDTYVNLPLYVQPKFDKMTAEPPLDAFYCYVFRNTGVIRDMGDKYGVTREEFPDDAYPTFCSGMAYVFRAALLPKILVATKEVKPLPMEDTYYTGVIAQHLNIQHVQIPMIDPFNDIDKISPTKLCQFGVNQEKTVVHRLSKRQMQVLNACIIATLKNDDY